MQRIFHTSQPMQTHYTLIVAGTGFASTFFLKKYLSKAPASARVLVLERGHLYPHAERLKELRGEKTAYAGLNPLPDDTFINHNPKKEWKFTTGFGGSSNCWYGCTPRFLPADFKLKTLYGVGSDWPIQYDELDPYYEQVEQIMDISGPANTPYLRKKPYPLGPHAFTEVDRLLQAKYGNLYISQPTARARQAVNGRAGCCASAVCYTCPVNAKFTIENSNMGVYDDPRVELVYGAAVSHLDLQGSVARTVHFTQGGQARQVSADAMALGTNALFNANLLLNSGDTNAFTGKGLGEQLGMHVLVYLKNLANVGGSTWVNANGYMLYEGEHRRQHAACLMEANNAPYLRVERGKWRDIATFRMIFEDLPQDRNFVATTSDPMVPAVHFDGPSDYALRGVASMKKTLPGILSCLPVEKIEFQEPFPTEAHILGTTRMSASASDGVVDKHLIHHQYRNLFVLGSGAFTTYSPNNPTLTLSALSLHAADKSF